MRGVLESLENHSTVVVAEVQLAWTAWSYVMVDNPIDFGAEWLILP